MACIWEAHGPGGSRDQAAHAGRRHVPISEFAACRCNLFGCLYLLTKPNGAFDALDFEQHARVHLAHTCSRERRKTAGRGYRWIVRRTSPATPTPAHKSSDGCSAGGSGCGRVANRTEAPGTSGTLPSTRLQVHSRTLWHTATPSLDSR